MSTTAGKPQAAGASLEQVDSVGERFRPWRTLAAAYLYRTRQA